MVKDKELRYKTRNYGIRQGTMVKDKKLRYKTRNYGIRQGIRV